MADIERIQTIMRDVFGDDELVISDQDSPDSIADWDSFANIQLLAAIENEFGIKFTTAQSMAVKNVADILEILSGKKSG